MTKNIGEPSTLANLVLRSIRIHEDWRKKFEKYIGAETLYNIATYISHRRKSIKVYPISKDVFAAFDYTSFENTKIVILGQDPYYNEGEAMGLAFGVHDYKGKLPPSLVNIIKEVQDNFPDESGIVDLVDWAEQGVLLLNTALTVEAGKPGSHAGIWKAFTEGILKALNEKTGVIYMLWGKQLPSIIVKLL